MNAPVIILSHPQLGENIGAAVRAMKNFGLENLRLIKPRDGWPNEKARHMAAGAADLLEKVQLYDDAASALADLEIVFATTARERGVAKPVVTPPECAQQLHAAAAKGIRTGILFGGERSGLDNDEVSLATTIVTIPTAEFSSLNLAQSVMLLCYEWFRAADETPVIRIDHGPIAKPATRKEMFDLFDHLESELLTSGFLYPPSKETPMVRHMRALLNRARLTDQEVRTIRGMIVALSKGKFRRPPPGHA
ncbi:MAG: RNA methyltransferase [Alphaproteobacteria bacterium]|nr:RNA methyltransferase [Alphaproteobacteria bacterium]MBL6939960.1 RNA methyltransferase [Alphaproteobacteria bacterium]MBL7098184.1 RNA methyltransferase [Alphaproteobacteria bacterium]